MAVTVKKAVLWRMQEDVRNLAVHFQIGENDLLVGIVVPLVARVFLIMPYVFARIRLERHNRGREEIVFFLQIPDLARPGIAARFPPRCKEPAPQCSARFRTIQLCGRHG